MVAQSNPCFTGGESGQLRILSTERLSGSLPNSRSPASTSQRGWARVFFLTAVVLGALVAAPARAGALGPDELLLVYNSSEPASRELAAYYADKRGVPMHRLLALDVDGREEEISAVDFETLIREPIRRHLDERMLRRQVRCLVTFHGLPIRVGQRQPSLQRQQLLDKWKRQFISALDELERAINELDGIGMDAPPRLSARMPTEADYPSLIMRYNPARIGVLKRIARITDKDSRERAQARLPEIIREVQGISGLLAQLEAADNRQADAARQQLQQMRRSARQAEGRINEMLARGLEDPARDEARKGIRQYGGLLGLLGSLEEDMSRIRPEETHAAVDSELALLWWDEYPKYRWVPNTLNWRLRTDADQWRRVPVTYRDQTVLMVSRIDAPTPLVARRMIDHAIAAERKGLAGKVYIDARGLEPGKGHGIYDQHLHNLARMLGEHTGLAVRLDNRPELFGPQQCPETMLYCGWYSLRKYVDAFDFVPGAVGYHVASLEAVSLRNPADQGWCKRMLKDGITATVGPVAEPYMHSFPLPEDFFGLLLTGRFSLVECYAYTTSFNSWMQMLLGDPLYRPFARRGYLTVEQVYEPHHIPAEFKPAGASTPAR